MSLFQQLRKVLITLSLVLVLISTTACAGAGDSNRTAVKPNVTTSVGGYYSTIERGTTAVAQNFGDWVVKTAQGMVQDAYVRDNDKLGVVISDKVRPSEVRSFAKSLAQGFHKSFPDRDLTVLMYAPDKKLILTAKYNNQTNQLEYQTPVS